MSKTVTYGAPGYMDWVARIRTGGATMSVYFSGGSLDGYGITPAEYSTDNLFVQKAIEKSDAFMSGKIVKLRESGGEARGKARGTGAATGTGPVGSGTETGDLSVTGTEPGGSELGGETGSMTAPELNQGLEQVHVSCVQDAQAYLTERFGIASRRVRSRAQVLAVGAENGIEFVFD